MDQDWFDQVSSDEQDFMDYYKREEEWIKSLDFRDHDDNHQWYQSEEYEQD